MERQFLTASLFFLLGLSSCQSNPTTKAIMMQNVIQAL